MPLRLTKSRMRGMPPHADAAHAGMTFLRDATHIPVTHRLGIQHRQT